VEESDNAIVSKQGRFLCRAFSQVSHPEEKKKEKKGEFNEPNPPGKDQRKKKEAYIAATG
jgi:hypothetical protein